jgi:hypothetical protein
MQHVATDLGSRESQVCVRNEVGEIVMERKLATARLPSYLTRQPRSRVIVETSSEAFFLALRLEVELQRRLEQRAIVVSWPDLMRDLEQVRAGDVTLDGQRYRLRTEMVGAAHHAFAAAGVRAPPAVT